MPTKSESEFKIGFNSDNEIIPIDEIVRIEGAENYSLLYTTKKKVLSTKTLKYFEQKLTNSHFLRIHKSHLVNMKHAIKMGDTNEYKLLKTSDGEELGISRRKSQIVRRFFESK